MTQHGEAVSPQRQNDVQILGKLDTIIARQSLMHTKLFGEPETETEHGRIPRLERKVAEDNERLDDLETAAKERRGGFKLVAAAISLAGLFIAVAEVLVLYHRP